MDRPLWVMLAVALAVGAGAASPRIGQSVPRYLFPLLAAVGAVLVVTALVRSVARLVPRGPAPGRPRVAAVFVYGVATIVLAVFPSAHLVLAMIPTGDGSPRILTGFGDWLGSEGYPRLSRHRGLDVAGRPGDDVLAAAEGRVTVARDHGDLCGFMVVIDHEPHGYRTVYCHLSAIAVRAGDRVIRGQRIGAVGTTGQRAWPGFEHVHLELQRGRDPRNVEDPRPRLAGCFAGTARYPADRLVLTYPVPCSPRR